MKSTVVVVYSTSYESKSLLESILLFIQNISPFLIG